MKLLMISPLVPLPADDGGRVEILNMVRFLRNDGHELHFVAPDTRANDARSFAKEVEQLYLIPLDPRSSLSGRLRHVASPLPYAAEKFFSAKALAEIGRVAAQRKFDAIHVEHLYVMRFASALKRHLGIPIVLHEHNIESEILRHYAEKTRNPLVRLYASMEFRKMRSFEELAIRDCDLVFPLTEHDAAGLRLMAPHVNIVPLPHGVDIQRLRFNHSLVPNRLLFLTNFDWLPNRESFEYFVREIHPVLSAALPELRTIVVGKDLHKVSRQGLPASIDFLGFLPDLNEVSSLASIALVPLQVGSGVRVKILELMAMGITVVSTRLGAEGIQAHPGEQLIISDTPIEIVRSVERLLGDQAESLRIATSARRFIEEHHSATAVSKIVEASYRSLLESWPMKPTHTSHS